MNDRVGGFIHDKEKKQEPKRSTTVSALKKESLAEHDHIYELMGPRSEEKIQIIDMVDQDQPPTTRTTGTTKTTSSDKWTYISDDVEPLISQAPDWFGEVLRREFVPPGQRNPSARSYRRLSRSPGISGKLKTKLENEAKHLRERRTPSKTSVTSYKTTTNTLKSR